MNRIAQGRPMSQVLLQGREGNVLVLTLNRPESRNAINLALAHARRIGESADALEGARAFVGKRTPHWSGS